jgi:preprotein translocase subunit SecG
VWIIYLVTDNTLLAWIAVADLVVVAIIGVVMVRQWAKDGRAAMAAATAGAAPSSGSRPDIAEQHIPRPPVVLHGIFAVSTLVLVLLTALGLGES